ncbi:hypothetical protein [Sphingomonas immobilis]|uniref:Uncharacterized protein n=1 Tax=Sphingomonas immobilis TaxID=3063997 RepID=A0ABT9A0R1_9SPHN|nr:hypothetical protein [Sphingomonas sp. CA1-15]MDO7842840.1 hypothetical protein [Sphingomonas sp. CA1-15]
MAWRDRYLAVRRWVDRDIKENSRPISPWVATPAFVLGVVMLKGPLLVDLAGGCVLLTALVWSAFALWRSVRQMKAGILRGDRYYDQRAKFALPPEYRDSESLTAARQRKRREAKRRD